MGQFDDVLGAGDELGAGAAGQGARAPGRQGARAISLSLAQLVAGTENVVELPHPIMGAEDFSYVLRRVPGSMMFLGGTPPEVDLSTAAPNHSNRVFFDEDAMATGIAMYAAVALDHLTGTG